MKRMIIGLFAALLLAGPLTIACSEKTTTYQRSERIEESDPQMVSPGREVVE